MLDKYLSKWKITENPDRKINNLQPGYKNGKWHVKFISLGKVRKDKQKEEEKYKYLGILEVDSMKQTEKKKKKEKSNSEELVTFS